MEMFAPKIEFIKDNFHFHAELIDIEIYKILIKIYQVFTCIKPVGDDDVREIWLEIPRGTIKDFGEFEDYKEEGIVDTYEQFEKLWIEYFPNKNKWYSFATAKYQKEIFFYFDSKLIFSIIDGEEPGKKRNITDTDIHEFLDWLFYCIQKEIIKIKQNADSYNKYLEKNLSYHKRFGRIKRKVFWNILGDKVNRLDVQLGPARINKFRKCIDGSKNPDRTVHIPRMTADDYFKYCEICYDANDYFKDSIKRLSPKEKYLAMADGRDAGLRSIEGDSQEAFLEWYHDSNRLGAHPWEICRGGNSTHISLFVTHSDNNWTLRLEGSSVGRVEEAVKMAIALCDKNIPFTLDKAEAILKMITGDDYIGIVPDYIMPRYCHSLFPDEDRIIDFMHLDYEEEEIIISNAYWYPLEKIEINKNISEIKEL